MLVCCIGFKWSFFLSLWLWFSPVGFFFFSILFKTLVSLNSLAHISQFMARLHHLFLNVLQLCVCFSFVTHLQFHSPSQSCIKYWFLDFLTYILLISLACVIFQVFIYLCVDMIYVHKWYCALCFTLFFPFFQSRFVFEIYPCSYIYI